MAKSRGSLSEEVKAAISGQGIVAASAGGIKDFSKAQAMTQAAIEGLGGPVYASMTDHKVVDTGLAKALTDVAISKGGIKSVNAAKAPADRAIAEALTLKAIGNGAAAARLSHTETKASEVDLTALQAQAQAEKDAKTAARTFGGGDAKAGMGNILKEIEGQGGIIAVPAEKANRADVSLNHAKAVMEINALGGEPIFASGTDCKARDSGLDQAKLLMAIAAKGETTVDPAKIASLEARASLEAHTIMALSAGKRDSLKSVDKPSEGLSKEQLASLQAAAAEEKK